MEEPTRDSLLCTCVCLVWEVWELVWQCGTMPTDRASARRCLLSAGAMADARKATVKMEVKAEEPPGAVEAGTKSAQPEGASLVKKEGETPEVADVLARLKAILPTVNKEETTGACMPCLGML